MCSKNFRHFYSHNEFQIIATPTGLSLGDLLNFIPTNQLEVYLEKDERAKRLSVQETIMHKFCASYGAYYCRSMHVKKSEASI